jgi:hypothetical protein
VSIVQTLLVFVGIPVAVYVVLAALVVLPGSARTPRYRPGEPWPFAPVWYLPQPARLTGPGHAGPDGRAALETGQPAGSPRHPELAPAAPDQVPPGAAGGDAPAPARTARGGVHDTW